MKKIFITALTGMILLTGCGKQSDTNLDLPIDNQEITKETDVKNYFTYQFIIPEDNPRLWPIGLHVPEGYQINKQSFDSNGVVSINKDTSFARFQFSTVVFNGNTDAILYFDRNIKNNTMVSSNFLLETFEGPTFAPFPGEEDITHSEATFASAMFTRTESEEIEVTGEIRIYWFDVKETETNKPASMGFVMMSEAKTEDWEDVKYDLDIIRKSIFMLPSRYEINSKMTRANLDSKTYSKIRLAQEEIELKQLQLQNGIMPAPGWKTILNQKIPTYSDKDDSYYLVDYIDTPSRLLPHPTIQGMTVNPILPEKLFKYLFDESE